MANQLRVALSLDLLGSLSAAVDEALRKNRDKVKHATLYIVRQP